MIPNKNKKIPTKEMTYKLNRRLLSKDTKMDIIVTTFYQGKEFCIYQTRLKKQNMPGEMPAKYANLRALSGYLSDDRNYRFDINTCELIITIKLGSAQIPIVFDMLPNVSLIQQNLLEYMRQNRELKSLLKKGRKSGMAEKLQKEQVQMGQKLNHALQNRVEIQNIKLNLQRCWKAQMLLGDVVKGIYGNLQKHIGLPIDEWLQSGCPVHTNGKNRRIPNNSKEKPYSRNRTYTQPNNYYEQTQKKSNKQQPLQNQHKFSKQNMKPLQEINDGNDSLDKILQNLYPMPNPDSPLGKNLAKLLPPNQATVSFFNALLMANDKKISSELTTYAKVIFGSILNSVEVILNKRNEYTPENIINQINLLQQCIKCKYIINNLGEPLYFGTRFLILQLVYEDENKDKILNDLQQRGIDFKGDQFVRVINGVVLRILENVCPQETVNIFLRMVNQQTSMQNSSLKIIQLIIKCLQKVVNDYSMKINEDRTIQFIMLVIEYFQIISLNFDLEKFNPSADEKLKPKEKIIKVIKIILTELGRHYGQQIDLHYSLAISQSKYINNYVGTYLRSIQQKNQKLQMKLDELQSKPQGKASQKNLKQQQKTKDMPYYNYHQTDQYKRRSAYLKKCWSDKNIS